MFYFSKMAYVRFMSFPYENVMFFLGDECILTCLFFFFSKCSKNQLWMCICFFPFNATHLSHNWSVPPPMDITLQLLIMLLGSVETYSEFSYMCPVFSPASAPPPLLLVVLGMSSLTPFHQPFKVSSVALKSPLLISIATNINPFSKTSHSECSSRLASICELY